MDVNERQPGDIQQLKQRISKEKSATQRDRYRAVLLAITGHPTREIQQLTGRSRGFVQRWVYVYRDQGIAAILPGRPTGAPARLSVEQQQAFKQRILAGPTEADGDVCTLRGRDAQRIVQREFGVHYSLNGVYKLLHQLNLTCLKPRPRHRKNDPQAMGQWLEDAPLLSSKSSNNTTKKRSKSGSRTKRGSASREP